MEYIYRVGEREKLRMAKFLSLSNWVPWSDLGH